MTTKNAVEGPEAIPPPPQVKKARFKRLKPVPEELRIPHHARYWLVMMYRWGDPENHAYPLGIYSSLDDAQEAATAEEGFRGTKYRASVLSGLVGVDRFSNLHGEDEQAGQLSMQFEDSKALRPLMVLLLELVNPELSAEQHGKALDALGAKLKEIQEPEE